MKQRESQWVLFGITGHTKMSQKRNMLIVMLVSIRVSYEKVVNKAHAN